jgi:[NiFe] hydrogenase diaphorase moiety large subunit
MGISKIVSKYYGDSHRLIDILNDVQEIEGFISEKAIEKIAAGTGLSSVDVRQTASFYHFLTSKPVGKIAIYLTTSAVAQMSGREMVAKAFEEACGCSFGTTSKNEMFGLFETSDIGMNDQEPAALINGVPFTRLTPQKAGDIVTSIRNGKKVEQLVAEYGDGKNASPEIKSMVQNNIRRRGEVYFGDYRYGNAIRKCVRVTPEAVLDVVKMSNLRGRGGAGFPTGMKWEFCKKAAEERKFVICNADEGEPGTFKDRVMLTELAPMVFEGMVAAGFVIGSREGVLYLRREYRYLLGHLEATLQDMRTRNLLGNDISEKKGFNFDIRIQVGAGAYVCGEETALIESAEGKRGEPRNRPPFPAQQGFLDKPTLVNNVETFAAIARIIDKGAEWFSKMGTDQSAGSKLFSVSGDCERPGVYEANWGLSIAELLKMVGATDTQAVQVGGPSGTCVGANDFDRIIGFEDLATGGSIIVIGQKRNLLKIVHNFMEFFSEESCGSCVPCRCGTRILKNMVKKTLDGNCTEKDLSVMIELGNTMQKVNKCGLGQTAANPVITSIVYVRSAWDKLLKPESLFDPGFNLATSVAASCEFVHRDPTRAETAL